MNSRVLSLCAAALAFGLSACANSASPDASSTSGASGTLLFTIPGPTVGTTALGSGVATSHFVGNDASFTSTGRILYYVEDNESADGNEHILEANLDGTGVQDLVNFGFPIASQYPHPKKSKDGQYVALNWWDDLRTTLGATYGTLVYKADGTPLYILKDVWDGDWSSDGRLVVSGTRTDFDGMHTPTYDGLFIYDRDFKVTVLGSGLTQPRYPAWSPDHTKIAFTMNGHLWTIHTDGTGLKQITSGTSEQTFPCWSPDGKYVAAQSTGDGGIISDQGMIIVPSDPSSPSTISSSTNYWIKDKDNHSTGVLEGRGNIDWK